MYLYVSLAENRIQDFVLYVSDSFDPNAFDNSQYTACTYDDQEWGAGETRDFGCDEQVFGRYVILQLADANWLTICELEVYGGCKCYVVFCTFSHVYFYCC